MKYIDADKLKAEIERLGRNWDGVQELQPVSLFQADLYELLDIIDSLRQEQPEQPCEDLDEAAEKYAYTGIPDEMKYIVKPLAEQIIEYFKAGAEWRYQKDRYEFSKLKARNG